MRRTKEIKLTLLAALALASTSACRPPRTQIRNCVDAQGHIVPDWDCDQSNNSSYGYHGGFHYVYGGSSGGRIGDTVVGGSATSSAGARVVSGETGSVVRGGFGRGSGGGGEGGGGE